MGNVVITGIGMVTPLGNSPKGILEGILNNESAVIEPEFETSEFDCSLCAAVSNFDPEQYFPDNKSLRLMNRDAQMAVVAAHLAMEDANVNSDITYPAEDIALYGSTGVAGMSIEEITRIIQYAACEDGTLNLENFGKIALKRVRPVLSFRILANMPICFVSIFQNIKGPNAVYTPWEGNGAQAIATGVQAINRGEVPLALVGGCDVKTRELSFINLQQLGIFDSWNRYGTGCIPGEGAAFLVLEDEEAAVKRGKRAYARISNYKLGSIGGKATLSDVIHSIVSGLEINASLKVIAAGDGDINIQENEEQAFKRSGLKLEQILKPKSHIGNLFAAAAAVQVGLGAELADRSSENQQVMTNCFGHGSEQGSFILETI
ncbi:MAG TPA: beta-ketoacyl synthase N-terminal-like domain-containing protein [Sedimentisphaerales bacterium]|nr:beta-ketoacyl synthase N-terminal-like domain-containing protein [Sedimentisphaerales bacterium]